MRAEDRRTTDLDRTLAGWARAERRRAVPDLWPRVRSRLAPAPAMYGVAAEWGTAMTRVAMSAAAALAATYMAGPWFYGSGPGVIPRLVGWAAAAPAWLFSWCGGWWQSLVYRLAG